jgi:hypothetical protein
MISTSFSPKTGARPMGTPRGEGPLAQTRRRPQAAALVAVQAAQAVPTAVEAGQAEARARAEARASKTREAARVRAVLRVP